MKNTLKLWTHLGIGTALAGGMLAACSGENGGEAGGEGADTAAVAPGGTVLGSGGGEGGEGEGAATAGGEGEGGVAVNRADTDPVVYGSALAVTEAHVIAAHDAFAAGQTQAAAEMFAHPASEVLVAMDPVFTKLGVKDFKPLLLAASDAVFDGKSAAEVDRRYEAIIAALRAAEQKAPASDASDAAVATGVIADQIERASTMYRQAGKSDGYEPYLDGYGFFKSAQTTFNRKAEAIEASEPEAHARIKEALALLAKAFPGATRPDKLTVEQGALSAASSRVMLAAGS